MSVLLSAAAISGVAMTSTAGAGDGRTRHDVDIHWETISTDVGGGSEQEDIYRSTGKPFGRSTVTTKARRGPGDSRYFDFTGKNPRGTFEGSCYAEKTYLETTTTRQLIKYNGKCGIDGGTGKYRDATGDRITFKGRADCRATGCNANFYLRGGVIIY